MPFRKRQESIKPHQDVLRTTCGNCPAGCGLKVHLDHGRVADIFGDEEHPANKGSICPKGLLTAWRLSTPGRLTGPMIRQGLGEPFQAVGWDEAIAFIAARLRDLMAAGSKGSVAVHAVETDPFDSIAAAGLFADALGTPLAPGRFFPGPFGPEGRIAAMFGVPAANLLSNATRDWCHSRCIVLYDCDLAASDPIALGPVLDARDRGATVLAVGTTGSVTASKADLAVRVKPGTQAVFLLGVLREILAKGLADEAFLAESCRGVDAFKAGLAAYTPDTVCRTCAVGSDVFFRFVELATKTKPLQILTGDWHSRRSLTDADLLACAGLVCLRGGLGVPGGGLNFLGASPFPPVTGSNTAPLSLERLLAGQDPCVSALFWHGDALARLGGGRATREALARVPLLVNLTTWADPARSRAHALIPVRFWLEYDGLLPVGDGKAVQCHAQVLEAPAECRSPREFWRDLARAADLDHPGLQTLNLDDRAFVDALLAANPLTSAMSFSALDPQNAMPGGLLWPSTGPGDLELESSRYVKGTVRGSNIAFQRHQAYPGAEHRFPTASGAVELTGDVPAPESPAAGGVHPVMLVTGVLVDQVERFGDQATDVAPEMTRFARINPKLAAALGVVDGDALVVENDLGRLSAKARLSRDVDPGVVWLPETTFTDPDSGDGMHPRALFPVPQSGNTAPAFAWVTVRRSGTDAGQARQAAARLLGQGGAAHATSGNR